ncbi:MAG: type II toxin-antitoxin system Phd/YefM family antitoxin [Rickettsiaceae bacterium]|jgi:hypothetical protein|nr:type II toxin-antitoxin system Phd/YefM family antitoxin [Rickettsiaceae bacterium]
MKRNYAPLSVGITDFQKEIGKILDEANGQVIALEKRGTIKAYIVPTDVYENMIDNLDNQSNSRKED